MADPETKDFDLGDVLSITTGHLVSPRHINGVYDILGWMTGEQLFTHQLPRVAKEAGPVLLAAHPQLAGVDASGITPTNWPQWLIDQKARFGETLPVPKMNENQHQRIDAMSEAAEHFHPDNIIVVSDKRGDES